MAQAQFKHEGDSINYIPGSAVAQGEVIVVNDLVCVAKSAIASGALGSLATKGVFEVTKETGTAHAMPFGTIVYWDDTNNRITTTSSGNKRAGKTVGGPAGANNAGASDTTALLMLNAA